MDAGFDVLAAVLENTGLRGQVYCRTIGTAPWGVEFDGRGGALFHLIVSGACFLVRGGKRLQLAAGDVVLIPRGAPHALVDDPRSKRITLADWLASSAREREQRPGPMRVGGSSGKDRGGAETEVLCGVYAFSTGERHPVLDLLPDLLHIRSRGGRTSSDLDGTVASLRGESERGAKGSKLVVSRLLDVLFVQIVRAWTESEPQAKTGWIGALDDEVLCRALSVMHAAKSRPWSVDDLAKVSGSSRATLARRFVREVGQPPLAYLTRIRLEDAARRLTDGSEGLAKVASEVGYTSEFAFSRAFRREYGTSPGLFRQQAKSAEVDRRWSV